MKRGIWSATTTPSAGSVQRADVNILRLAARSLPCRCNPESFAHHISAVRQSRTLTCNYHPIVEEIVSKYPVVSSREELEVVFSDLRRVLNLSARLPDFPFLTDDGFDSFCNDVDFNGGSFGTVFEALALQYHDDFVSGARIDPHYQIDEEDIRGNFTAYHIPSSRIADQYWHALLYEWNDNPAEAMQNNWDVMCAAGSSGSWAVWGERMMGIAIVRTVGSDMSWRHGVDGFLPAKDAIDVFIGQEFYRTGVPENLRQTFLRNVRPIGIGDA